MSKSSLKPRHPALAIFFVITGLIGLWAAFDLSVEKFLTLQDPTHVAACTLNIFVNCGINLGSTQGAIFGFPNPFIGLVAWPCVISVGAALLAGARMARWYWLTFNVCVAAALVFVCWLIYQSFFILDSLCLWCLVTWVVTIPLFWVVTLFNLAEGRFSAAPAARRVGTALLRWVPLITVVCYAIIALVAQLQANAFNRL